MGRYSVSVAALAICLGGCATIMGPDYQPKGSDTAATEEEKVDTQETDGATYDDVDPFGTDPEPTDDSNETVADDSDDTGEPNEEGAGRGADDSAPPAKKTCPDLDESTCKITVGCVWNSVENCVDEY